MGSDLTELGSGVCRLTFTRAYHRHDASLDRFVIAPADNSLPVAIGFMAGIGVATSRADGVDFVDPASNQLRSVGMKSIHCPCQRYLSLLFVSLVLIEVAIVKPASACTIFVIVRDGSVLMGNNEDFTKRGAIWFVPASKGKLGRVNVGFHNAFDRRENFAQGSMNENGLAFDAAVTAKVPWTTDPEKETPDNLLEKIMDECSTVTEATKYFQHYNCPYLAKSQFLFADANGASAVFTWLPGKGLSIVNRQRTYQVVTNTRLEASGYRCQRWVRAGRELQVEERSPFESARRALQSVHQHGPGGFTSYSCIYDLKRRKIYLYNLTNFREVVDFDVRLELQKGMSSHLLKHLFADSPSLQDVRSKLQRVSYQTKVRLNRDSLVRFEGSYRPDIAPEITVKVEATNDGLRVRNPGQQPAELFPEGPLVFRIAPDRGRVTFHVADNGQVTGLTLQKGRDVHASRIIK